MPVTTRSFAVSTQFAAEDAILAEKYDVLKGLVKRHKPTDDVFITRKGLHVINLAAKLGDLQALRVFLVARWNPDQLWKGFYPLHSAALHGKTKAVELLVQWKADVNARTGDGQTALMLAAINGHTATAEKLVELGADVNARNQDRQTALMLAAINGHTATVEKLLALGADRTLRNTRNQTAAGIALKLSVSPNTVEKKRTTFAHLARLLA